ncbi:MAG: polysaccharide deacetylase family protein [Chloroflexi bacterium]|nr:polysaccharide deacetylase family protein [Chloroflexota bacterium]
MSLSNRVIPILLYHRVTDEPVEALRAYAVSPSSFAQQMLFLSNNGYRTVSLQDLVDHRQTGKPLPKKPIVITFDDGYRDNYVHAYPLLLRHGFTAIVFLVAKMVSKLALWDRAFGGPPPKLLSWTEIAEMADGGISFGSHACTHPALTRLPVHLAREEIVRSKEIVETGLQRPVSLFAFPYNETSQTLRDMVAESGYLAACSSSWGRSDRADGIFDLRRLAILSSHDIRYFQWAIEDESTLPLMRRWLRGKRAALRRFFGDNNYGRALEGSGTNGK